MGKKDMMTNGYLNDPMVFADVFNMFLYEGEPVIDAARLKNLDTRGYATIYGSKGSSRVIERTRDVVKTLAEKADDTVDYCILGIEGQNEIHYAAPVRNGLYDFVKYADQVRICRKKHEEEAKAGLERRNISSGEFLSGFYKNDRLKPVVTVIIYFGPDEWDGPLSLREMYSTNDEEILRYSADYKINIIAPYSMSDEKICQLESGMREILLFIKYSKDKFKLEEILNKNERFRHMDRDAVELIKITTGAIIDYDEEEDKIDMCQAQMELINDARMAGKIEGKIEGAIMAYKSIGKSLTEIVNMISEQFNITKPESEEKVKELWD